MMTSISVNTDTQNLVFNNGSLTLSNIDGSPINLPGDYVDAMTDEKDTPIIEGIKRAIQKPHNNQMQLIASASLELGIGNITVKRILKKYENLVWSYHKEGKGKQSQSFTYFIIHKK